jgi:hypothetical protein
MNGIFALFCCQAGGLMGDYQAGACLSIYIVSYLSIFDFKLRQGERSIHWNWPQA